MAVPEQGAQVVPFGKYKGQPAEVLMADAGYRDWLLAQPWFRERYGNIYNVVINYGTEPQDSPEHNEMQASFLDDAHCLRLAGTLAPKSFGDSWGWAVEKISSLKDPSARAFTAAIVDPAVHDRIFESGGWDVVYRVAVSAYAVFPGYPECACGPCDDHGDCPADSLCHLDHANCQPGGHCREADAPTFTWHGRCGHEDHGKRAVPEHGFPKRHHRTECPWALDNVRDFYKSFTRRDDGRIQTFVAGAGFTLRVELKPDLGDDFPSVLRQVKGYGAGRSYEDHRRVVVVRRAEFAAVTFEQVRQMFEASDICLIRESDLA